MLDNILSLYRASTYDFRCYANPDDPLGELFKDWVSYYRMKWAIGKALRPQSILEIGVRYGYSAHAFLDGNPEASYIGIDADVSVFGGQSGATDWAESNLASLYNVKILKQDSQQLNRLPGDIFDLIHIDGQQDGDGTYHDLDLASMQGRYILVDGYHWTRENFMATNEWLWLNKAAIQSILIIPGYAGELLIRTNITDASTLPAMTSGPLVRLYTNDYYVNDCGGYLEWRRSNGKEMDPRLQAVADVGLAISTPSTVVDLGAGRGELTRLFARQGAHVISIDYSRESIQIIENSMSDSEREMVDMVCDSVLNLDLYVDRCDLALASDIVEHLSPDEVEILYQHVSSKLSPCQGSLVIHTAPNLWCYRYEHSLQQKSAKEAGGWLPKTRRTWYERLMHINEQNPRILKKQLSRHFPFVLIWFADDQGMVGSLGRKFRISDFRRSNSVFAVASHRPIELAEIIRSLAMPPLVEENATAISLQAHGIPVAVRPNVVFIVQVQISNKSSVRLSSMPPNPVNLSYHWYDERGNISVYDGLRTALLPPLHGQQTLTYAVKIKSPAAIGRYILRLAWVQENVRWHDAPDPKLNHIINVVQ